MPSDPLTTEPAQARPDNSAATIDPAASATSATAQLAQQLADAVTAVPGVIRLEPTMQNAIRMIAGRTPTGTARFGEAVVGVRVLLQGSSADISAEIAIDDTNTAAATALAVEQALVDTLRRHGHTPRAVTVTVLAIEQAPGGQAAHDDQRI